MKSVAFSLLQPWELEVVCLVREKRAELKWGAFEI